MRSSEVEALAGLFGGSDELKVAQEGVNYFLVAMKDADFCSKNMTVTP